MIVKENLKKGCHRRADAGTADEAGNMNYGVKREIISVTEVIWSIQLMVLDTTFADIKTESKAAFIESLKAFQNNNRAFLVSIINRELASGFGKSI